MAVRENTPQDDLADMGYRVAGTIFTRCWSFWALLISPVEDLTSKKRYSDASRVLLDYSKDVREAIIALVQGSEFSEARRIVSKSEINRTLF